MQELVAQVVGYLRGIWHRRWIGLGVAWIVAVVGSVVIYRMPDEYQASARVFVDTQSMLRPLMQGMAISTDPSYQVSLLSRLLFSRPNLEKIIRKGDFDTAAGKSASSLVDEFGGRLSIARAGGDNIYTVAFTYPDGRKARDVVQAALSTFIEQSLGENKSGAESARRFLDAQIKDYERRLQEAEARSQAFKLKNMALLGTSGRDYLTQMSGVVDQVKDSQVELRVAEETRDGIKKQLQELESRTPQVIVENTVPTAVPELDGRIDGLKRQADELLRRFTDLHPDVVAIKRQIAQLQDERDRVLEARRKAAESRPKVTAANSATNDPVVQQLRVALSEAESNVVTVRARLAEYQNRIAQLRAAAEAVPRIETELSQMNRDYGILQRQYDALVSRRETANMTGKLDDAGIAEFRIIDPPRLTPNPVAPNRIRLLLMLLGGALLAGIGTSFLVSQIWPTFHDSRILREVTNRPLLGMISMVPSPTWKRRRMRSAVAFAGGLSGFLLINATALAMAYIRTRGY
ncbi:MAG TPA: XrtA system polysaccharide chain length determinant [Burkholderiales bacterium]|nr:XrtA system polysaccharide chain length determinant [Burkholderiales bacterium]